MKLAAVSLLTSLVLFFAGCENKTDATPQSALKMDIHTAVLTDNIDIIKQHINTGSDLNVQEPSRASTPLITAAVFGKTEAAKLLIDAGADLNYKNKDGSTALHSAAFFCSEEIVKALLEKGANKTITNADAKTALEIVEIPFESVKVFYDAIGNALKPAGLVLDYEHIKATRPVIAEMLR